MGTNYYLAPTGLHICKSLTGFQGHSETPYGPIAAWADWRRILHNNVVSVVDEYGQEFSAEEFIADVESTLITARRRQFDYMQNEYPATELGRVFPYMTGQYWLDSDYFTFTLNDFT